MFSSKTNKFQKSADCPSSQKLLAFQNRELAPRDQIDIQRHIIDCEFCEAEIELYADYPPQIAAVEDDCETGAAEIPMPLYELAEALLGKRYSDYSLLNRLLNEAEKVPNFK